MAEPAAATTATACSKCDGTFSADGLLLAGVCSSCPDGDALCQRCAIRHSTDVRFSGHAYRSLEEEYVGLDFLARHGLVTAPEACLRHSQPFLGLCCASCSANNTDTSTSGNLCAACVAAHTPAHPTHLLAPFAPNVAGMRAQLGALGAVRDSTSAAPASKRSVIEAMQVAAQTAPLVETARRKVLAAQAELAALAAHREDARARLEANRDAIMVTLQSCIEASMGALDNATVAKRTALESELEAADAALSAAAIATTALVEV